MSDSSSNSMCRLLHAYELGRLTEDERLRFEEHLLDCDSCFEELQSFERTAAIVASDASLRRTLEQARRSGAGQQSWWRRLWAHLWPDTNLLLKPAVVYFALTLLIYPAYLGFHQQGQDIEFTTTTALVLTPTRDGVPETQDSGSTRLLTFVVFDAREDFPYLLKLTDSTGHTIYEEPNYRGFSSDGVGHLILPSGGLSPGTYEFTVAPSARPDSVIQTFIFRVTD